MEIARIDIKDKSGHLIAFYSHGIWSGFIAILPKAIELMMINKSRSAFQRALEKIKPK